MTRLCIFFSSVDCQWAQWNGWTNCSSECPGGSQTRTRLINVTMNHGGKECNQGDCQGVNATENCRSQNQECNEDKECQSMNLDSLMQYHFFRHYKRTTIRHSFIYNSKLDQCDFFDGDVLNKGTRSKEIVGHTNTEHDCARSVKQLITTATGALWLKHNKTCFAEFGNETIASSNTSNDGDFASRACLFPGIYLDELSVV